MKNKFFSMFQINWRDGDKHHISVFAIPKSRESEFIKNPRLAYKSLDAKELYSIEVSQYKANQGYHDAQIDSQFDHYVGYMMNLMGCTD